MKETRDNLNTISIKQRIHWVDVAKGILILLLLIHHFGSAIKNSEIPKQDFYFVFVWQYLFVSFFMQAFFFLSGFCSNFDKPISSFFKKLFLQLVIPLFFFQFLHYIWTCYYKGFIGIDQYLLKINGTNYWFIVALIISKIYLYFFLKIFSNHVCLLFTTLVIFVFAIFLNDFEIGSNYLYFRNSLGSILFVALGQYFKWKRDLLNTCLLLGCVYPVVLAIIFFTGIKPPLFTAMLGVSLKTTPIFLITSFSGIMAFIFLCKRIGNSRSLEYFGKNSLLIYGFHFIPLKLLVLYFYGLILPSVILGKLVYLILVYLIEIVILILLIEIFNKKPFMWLVGKI